MTQHAQQKKESKIPEFKNRQEMAAFWDTHDIADYQDEFKTVNAVFDLEDIRQQDTIAIRVQRDIKDKLAKIAKAKGLSISSLTRMWILEKL